MAISSQVGGGHYHKRAIQPITYIQANKLGYEEGNIVKYVTRHADKGGAEDCKKAIQYFLFILANQYDVVGTVEYADCSEVSDGPRYYPPSE